MDIKGLVWEGMDWFHLAQDCNERWAVVSIFCRSGHCVASFRGIASICLRSTTSSIHSFIHSFIYSYSIDHTDVEFVIKYKYKQTSIIYKYNFR